METIVAYILLGLVHLLVLGAIVGMIYFLWYVITEKSDPVEKLLRVAALAAGLLIYVGAKALGISIPGLMASALAVTNPFTVGLLSVVVPAAAGTLVAWYCLRLMRRNSDVAARGLVLFSAFVFTMFADSYLALTTQATSTNASLILPNITFVIGVVLYTIFEYKPGDGDQGKDLSGMAESLGQGIRKFKVGLSGKEASNGEETRHEAVDQSATNRNTHE